MGQSRPLFVYFCKFSRYNFNKKMEKSIVGVLGIRTQGHRMVGADKTTELWQPGSKKCLYTMHYERAANLAVIKIVSPKIH